jgi:hypothetical protein
MPPRQPVPPVWQPTQHASAATVSEGTTAIKQRKWRSKETTTVNSKQNVVDPTLDGLSCSTRLFLELRTHSKQTTERRGGRDSQS